MKQQFMETQKNIYSWYKMNNANAHIASNQFSRSNCSTYEQCAAPGQHTSAGLYLLLVIKRK
uniref:Uncharacterized protein n=1 Tax=Setaria italica TaxID=4555 RepID=K3YXI5_SETIT